MPIPGKLEVTIKINQLPPDEEVVTDKNGWKKLTIDCAGRAVQVALRPRMWMKLVEAKTNWPLWIATINGVMGPAQGSGFVLQEPAVQVFERKQRPPEDPPPPAPSS